MRCPKTRLTPPFVVLSLLFLSPSGCKQEQIDSFCQLYTKVIVEKGDASIKAPIGMKRRLLANELLYKAECSLPKA